MRDSSARSGRNGSTWTSKIRIAKPLLLGLAPLGFFLFACPSCRPLLKEVFESPRVRVADIDLSGNPFSSKDEIDLVLHLGVHNPNPYALNVSGVAYTAMVGNRLLTEGEWNEPTRIAPAAETIVQVPVRIRTDSFAAAVREVIASGKVSYEFNGLLGVVAPVAGVIRVPFSRSGKIDPLEILRKKGIVFR